MTRPHRHVRKVINRHENRWTINAWPYREYSPRLYPHTRVLLRAHHSCCCYHSNFPEQSRRRISPRKTSLQCEKISSRRQHSAPRVWHIRPAMARAQCASFATCKYDGMQTRRGFISILSIGRACGWKTRGKIARPDANRAHEPLIWFRNQRVIIISNRIISPRGILSMHRYIFTIIILW